MGLKELRGKAISRCVLLCQLGKLDCSVVHPADSPSQPGIPTDRLRRPLNLNVRYLKKI